MTQHTGDGMPSPDATVKWCGKSAPASWWHGGQVNPTWCKAE